MKDHLKSIPVVFVFLLCSIPILTAQDLRFKRFSVEDGLSYNGSYQQDCIIQDREGFLWFGTFFGINRFDGREFKIFQHNSDDPNSLGHDLTTALCQMPDGKIWVGTGERGLYIFDPETEAFTSWHADPENPNSPCGEESTFIRVDREGNVWMGTRFTGACRWSPKAQEWTSFEQYFPDAHSFYEDKSGKIWIGSRTGLFRKSKGSEVFERVGAADALPGFRHWVRDFTDLPNGNVLMNTRQALYELDPVAETIRVFEPAFPSKQLPAPDFLLTARDGKIWMGTINELWQYNPALKQYKCSVYDPSDRNSTLAGSNSFLIEDKANSIWLTSPAAGVAVTHNARNPFEAIWPKSPVQEFLPFDTARILINTEDGFELFNRKTGKFETAPPGFQAIKGWKSFVRKIGDEIFIQPAGSKTVRVIQLKTGKKREIPAAGTKNAVDKNGLFWMGFQYYDEQNRHWVDRSAEVYAALPDIAKLNYRDYETFFDDQNRIWIATNQGVFRYDFATKEHRHFKAGGKGEPASLVNFNFFPGSDGRFYLFGASGLSIYLPGEDSFVNFNRNNGLLHNSSGAVVEDKKGFVWIGGPLGLQKLDLKTKAFTNFSVADGLFSDNFHHHRPYCDEDGFLYFGTREHLLRFHPDSIRPRTETNSVYLMDFFIRNKKVAVSDTSALLQKQLRYTERLNLTFDQNDFGFSFVMPVYYKSEATEYFYKLEPYENDWINAGGKRVIQYTNIDPGKYTFKVKARTAAGVWSPNEASVRLYISPPWWETWWAYLIYLTLLFVSVFGLYKFQLNRQIERAEAQKLLEMDSLKTRLYTNITHEFRTPLTVILGLTEQLNNELEKLTVPDGMKELFSSGFILMHRNGKNLLRMINQMLDLSKLESGSMQLDLVQADIVTYLQYLTESFYSMAQEKNIRLVFYPEMKALTMDYSETKLQHIIYNLLSNAIKFTEPGGKIVFHASREMQAGKPVLKLKISDTGIGIPSGDLKNIFNRFYQVDSSSTRKGEGTGIGLALIKELVDLLGGKISVESEPGVGTTFTIFLSITNKAPRTAVPPKPALFSGSSVPSNTPIGPSSASPDQPSLPIVLIVEDNRDVATYIYRLLENDYQCVFAVNGRNGLEMALELVPDIIVSDVMMPEMDGIELTELLKNDERTSHIPIVLLTAKATEADKIEGLKTGADAYLMKPFNKEELFVRLEKLLELRRTLQERYKDVRFPVVKVNPGREDIFIQKIRQAIEAHIDDPELGIAQLCSAVHLSSTQVFRKVKALTGENPTIFIRQVRLHKAMELLRTTNRSVSEIAYDLGFTDPNYFSRVFSEAFGMAPSAARK